MSKLRSVIVGCGSIFPMHAASIINDENAKLVAVCDTNEERAKNRAQECKCVFYTDYKDMIEKEKPDCVHICLPHYLHALVSIYALEHGCNVICEKPMATSVLDAKKMIEASKRTGKKLGIILQNRYNQVSRFIKNAIEDGTLGKVLGARASVFWCRNDEYYTESGWRGSIEKEGGSVCANQAIHTLDLMLWFVGKKVLRIDSSTSTLMHNIETEDEASGVITFEDGIRANFFFTVNHFTDEPVEIEIIGENGVAKLVGYGEAKITLKNGEILTPEIEKPVAIEYGAMKSYWGYAHVKQISNFYRHLKNNEPLFVDCNDALETQKIVCAILEAGKTKKSIDF